MIEHPGCGDIRQSLGVYVIGAIDPAERAVVDAHLSTCQDCRDELAGLAGLPALLGRVPREDAERLALDGAELRDLEEPPAELLDSLLRRIAERRRTRRWRGVVAAAAAAVIAVGGGIGGGVLISHGHGATHASVRAVQPPAPDLVRGGNPATNVTAAVYYFPTRQSGTAMQVQVSGIRDGTYCKLWLTTKSGRHLLVGGWLVNGGPGNWYEASSPVTAASVSSFDITAGGNVLVTIPAT
jgi:anti-sigma factor RsiW